VTGPGREVWDLLARPCSTDDLVEALCQQFQADPATVRGDVEALLSQLLAAGAVEELPAVGT